MMKNQTCNFCENPESIITKETCCTGCSKLDEKVFSLIFRPREEAFKTRLEVNFEDIPSLIYTLQDAYKKWMTTQQSTD